MDTSSILRFYIVFCIFVIAAFALKRGVIAFMALCLM